MNRLKPLAIALVLSVMPSFATTGDGVKNEKLAAQLKIAQAIEEGRFQEAEEACKLAIAAAEKDHDSGSLVSHYGLLATSYRAQGRNEKAIDAYKKAIDSLSSTKKDLQSNRTGIAMMQTNIGETYRTTGDLETALSYLMQAKKNASPAQNPAYPELLQTIAMTYVRLDRYVEAEAAFKEAIALAKRQMRPKAEINSSFSLALLYSRLNRLNDLRALLEHTIPLSEKTLGESDNITKQFRQLTGPLEEEKTKGTDWKKLMEAGRAARSAGDYQKSLSNFSSAAKEADRVLPNSLSYATSLLDLSATYLTNRQFKEAEENAAKALPIFERFYPEDAREVVVLRQLHAKAKELAAQAVPEQQVTSTPQAPAATK
jgi:tetratricopeptide (TPR) repeat protein